MECPRCAQNNRPGAKFCDECGATLGKHVINDGVPSASTNTESIDSPERVNPTAEELENDSHGGRRQLTVMFCDIVGSTALASDLDPEEWSKIVRFYQSTSSSIIENFSGYIAQYLGDGLLVYFGYPVAREDAAVRAVKAGLGILSHLDQINKELVENTTPLHSDKRNKGRREIRLRLGIHTGQVVVGGIGAGARYERLALGETPNIAARLQSLARANTIVLSAATYRLVQGFFECHTLGPHALKGVATPISVYQVVREERTQSRFEVALEAGLTPLVGRDQEVTFLRRCWNKAKVGSGQVISLGGEPGIGKSRLVQDAKEKASEEGHAVREFRCSSYAQNTAFYPVIEHLQRWLQLQGEEPAEEKFRRLETAFEGYKKLPEGSVILFASLLRLPLLDRYDVPQLSPEKEREKIRAVLVAWLCEESAQRPLLMVWEDLHWADPSTVDLIQVLIDRAPKLYLFALLPYRLSEFVPPWTPANHLNSVTLSRLDRHPVETLINNIANGRVVTSRVLDHIVTQADGVPLFVEELTKTVIESGVLEKEESEIPSLTGAIPSTLQDSLMARLDQLSSTAREVAQTGAVLGRAFSFELIEAVWSSDGRRLSRGLRQLVDSELVFQKGVGPQARWVFKHAMMQDTAYQSLLLTARRQIHRRAAAVLVERFPDTRHQRPELVAHHYTEAGALDEAIGFWQYAGEQALERSAHREGIRHLSKGLKLLSQLPEAPDRFQRELTIQTKLGPSLMATKGYAAPEVERAYARAQQLCLRLGETTESFPVLRGMWVVHEMRAQLKEAREICEQLLTLAKQLDDPELLIEVHRALGNTLLWIGEFAHAREHLRTAITLYDPRQHRGLAFQYGTDPRVVCMLYETLALWISGYPEQADKRGREAMKWAREEAHQHSLAVALHWTSFLHQLRGDASEAGTCAGTVVELAQEHGFPHWEMIGRILQVWAACRESPSEREVQNLEKVIATWRASGAELLHPYFLGLLAEQYGLIGQSKKALALLDQAISLIADSSERFSEAELWRLRGELLTVGTEETGLGACPERDNRRRAAEKCFRKSIKIAGEQGARAWELRASTSFANLYIEQGKAEGAYGILAPVVSWFQEGYETRDMRAARHVLEQLENER